MNDLSAATAKSRLWKNNMEKTIAPAILVKNFDDFAVQVKRLENIFDYAQIDVMDGEFVANTSFPDIEKINKLETNLKFELHLMVRHPLSEIAKWKEIKNIFRIIFHIESGDDPVETISAIRGQCGQVGIALNPETPLSAIEPYYKLVNLVMFMTVHPGRQGAPFVPSVRDKIIEFCGWPDRPLCAVDGGIKPDNIWQVSGWGVDIFNIGASLVMSPDIKKTYEELKQKII
jgi:ribulose-phosphate 3-epimerase